MTIDIITEQWRHVYLLRALLQDLPSTGVEISWAGSVSLAESTARWSQTLHHKPVAVVVGAKPEEADELRSFLKASLSEFAGEQFFHVTVVVPAIERVLFADEQVIEQLIQRSLNPEEIQQAQTHPYEVLKAALPLKPTELPYDSVHDAFKKRLPSLNLDALHQVPEIADLRAFVQRVASTSERSLAVAV